jgi:hypothetical protein
LAATVTFSIKNNVWFLNAFRFGVVGDTSWSFTNKDFLCDLKSDPSQTNPDLSLSSTGPSPATILVLDPIARVLQFNVEDLVLRNKLSVGPYQYDLIMVDDTTGERDMLMSGVITVMQGVTLED